MPRHGQAMLKLNGRQIKVDLDRIGGAETPVVAAVAHSCLLLVGSIERFGNKKTVDATHITSTTAVGCAGLNKERIARL